MGRSYLFWPRKAISRAAHAPPASLAYRWAQLSSHTRFRWPSLACGPICRARVVQASVRRPVGPVWQPAPARVM
jgi:hypothetical protein